MLAISVLSAVLPSLVLLWFFYSWDVNPAPGKVIWITFGLDWDPLTRMRLFILDGLTVYGSAGIFTFYLPELFPTRLRGTGSGFCFNAGRYVAAAGPFVVGHALGMAATPMDAIRWVAIVPLFGLLLVPVIVETEPRLSAGARGDAVR